MVSGQTVPSAAFPDTQFLNGAHTLQQFNGALGTLYYEPTEVAWRKKNTLKCKGRL